MAIYIPGWYDQMAQSGSISKLGDIAGRKFMPDFRANQDLQKMVQQNPNLMTEISNMDDAARLALSKSLGFVNKDPLAALPVGAQRQERERITKTRAELMKDPTNAAEINAKEFGLLTPEQRKTQSLTLEGRVIDNKTGQLKLDVLEKEVAKTEGILAKKAPELVDVARAVVYGKAVPAEAMERIYADENLSKAYVDYYKAFSMEREGNIRKSLASMRTPQDKAMAIAWVEKELDNTRMNLQNLRSKIGGRDGFLAQMNPATKGQYDQSVSEAERLQKRLLELENVYAEEMTKQGVKIPKNQTQPTGPITPGPLANPANRMPLNQIDGTLFKR
jgi:hypothetical protein